MGFNSQTGQIGFGIQSVKGTPVAATRFARIKDGSLGGTRNLIVPDPEIGGNRDVPEAYLGPVGFGGDLNFYPRMRMLALMLKSVLGASSSTFVAGSNEVQTITITGTPTGGTFTLMFRGETTAAIAYNATAAAVATALQALNIIGVSGCTTGGGPLPGTPVTVTFVGALAASNPPPITVRTSALTGGTTPAVAVTTTTPGVAVIGTHVITPTNVLPWLTIEERVSNTLESFRYTDGKINQLKLNVDANGLLMGSVSPIAITQTSGFSAQANPLWDDSPMVVGGLCSVTLNGTAFPSKQFSLEVNNNIETDDFYIGSPFVGDLVEKRREMKMGLTYRPQDAVLWKAATYGDSAYTTPQGGRAYRGPVTILMKSFETIGDVVSGTPFSCLIEIPTAVVAPFKLAPAGDDTIQNDLEITPIRPDSNAAILTATVVNDQSVVS